MEYDYSCCYYCPHLHKNKEWSSLLFCLVSVCFFVIAALKIRDGRIAVCWGMMPCSACHSRGLNCSGMHIQGGRQENSHQAGIPANPGRPGALESRAEVLNVDTGK